MLNLSILDDDGTMGIAWPSGSNPFCGHDGQFPCDDDPLPVLQHGAGWTPAGTGRLTFVPVGAGAYGGYNDFTVPNPVPVPSNNAPRPTPTATPTPTPTAKPFDFEAWFKANKTMALAGGGLLLVLLLKK